MDIDLSRLTNRETVVEGDVRLPDDPLGAPGSLEAEGVTFPEPVHVDATARKAGDVVVVTGRVTGSARIACSRCLVPVDRPVDVEFEARWLEAGAAPAPPAGDAASSEEDGFQLAPEDLDVAFLPPGTTRLDVGEIVREQVVLDLPYRVTCRPDCAGLCPRCGADRNQGPCACPQDGREDVDPRLAALAELRRRLEGS